VLGALVLLGLAGCAVTPPPAPEPSVPRRVTEADRLAALGEHARAREAAEAFLQAYPDDPEAPRIRVLQETLAALLGARAEVARLHDTAAERGAELERLRDELAERDRKLARLQQDLGDRELELAFARETLDASDAELARLRREIGEQRAEARRLASEAEKLRADLEQLRQIDLRLERRK
jgi:chromosome segregation ATPase